MYVRRPVLLCMLLLGSVFPAMEAGAQTPPVEDVTIDELHWILNESDAALKVVNFWATWCGPCIEEFPDFVRLGKDLADQKVSVFFVSMDFEEEKSAVEAFLAEKGYLKPLYLRIGKDNEFIEGMSKTWTGALPATFLYSRNDTLIDFWQGKPLGYEALHARALNALQP